MNITDLIVELLKQGKAVEMPGIGTLSSEMQQPHHDPTTGTLYPASRTIAFSTAQTGSNTMVKELARIECVSEEVATQMWRNYIDALTDRMKSKGSHRLGDLGVLGRNADKQYTFTLDEGVTLPAGNDTQQPIAGVKTYSHEGEADPFAQFEPEEVPVLAPEPEPEPVPEPVPVVEPEPPAEPETPETPDTLVNPETPGYPDNPDTPDTPDTPEIPETPETPEPPAEPEPVDEPSTPTTDDKERRRIEKHLEEERRRAEKKAEEERRRAEEELRRAEKKAEEEHRKAEKEAEKARIKAEKKAAALAAVAAREEAKAQKAANAAEEKARQQAEKEAARRQAAEKKEAERKAKENKKLADSLLSPTPTGSNADTDNKGKKKSKLWLLLLLLCLVVVAAGGIYYLLAHRSAKPAATPSVVATNGQHLEVGIANSLTYNTDAIRYSQREMSLNRDMVCNYLSDYINDYLASRGYRGAKASMMNRVGQYVGDRMADLMGPRFAVQNIIPYTDYIADYLEPELRAKRAQHARITVQSELLDYSMLDNILDNMIDELGLQPDGAKAKTTQEVQQVKKQEKATLANQRTPKGETPVYVYVEKNSKQGFDIIAGFYLNKATAAKMTARLHDLGCDAYIIEKDDNFYVSMGSAKTRTAAEALYKHIKSWYDGDVVIKEW